MEFKELEQKVIQWGIDRDLYHSEHGANATTQLQKFFEEFGELNQALLKNDKEAIKDAIGDCQVCLIHRAKFLDVDLDLTIPENFEELSKELIESYTSYKKEATEEFLKDISTNAFEYIEECLGYLESFSTVLGYNYLECLSNAYNEIKDRKGKMINGTFVKE